MSAAREATLSELRRVVGALRPWASAYLKARAEDALAAFQAQIEDIASRFLRGDLALDAARAAFRGAVEEAWQREAQFAWREGGGEGYPPPDLIDEEVARQLGFADKLWDEFFAGLQEREDADDDGERAVEIRLGRWVQSLVGWFNELKLRGAAGVATKAGAVFTWALGDAEHCATCRQLARQGPQTAGWFLENNYVPGKPGANLDCGGWDCKCVLLDKNGEPFTLRRALATLFDPPDNSPLITVLDPPDLRPLVTLLDPTDYNQPLITVLDPIDFGPFIYVHDPPDIDPLIMVHDPPSLEPVVEADGGRLTASNPSFEQVGYGSTELSRAALDFRIRNPELTENRNVSVFEVRHSDGTRRYLIEANIPRGGHSEAVLFHRVSDMKKNDPELAVTRIYSEREPCTENPRGVSCADLVSGAFPNAEVTYSIPYNTPEERDIAAERLLEEISSIDSSEG